MMCNLVTCCVLPCAMVQSTAVCFGGSCVRDGVASFFYFSTYEYLKKAWTPEESVRKGFYAAALPSPIHSSSPLKSFSSCLHSSCCSHPSALSVRDVRGGGQGKARLAARQGSADGETAVWWRREHVLPEKLPDGVCQVASPSPRLLSCPLPDQVFPLHQCPVRMGRERKDLGRGQHSWQGA